MQAGLPSWGRLLRIMVEQVKAGIPDSPAEELESLLERNKFLEVAEYCKDQLGKNQFASILAENVSGRDGPIPEAHRLIANTPFAGVITTNYDKLLERGYAESGKGMPKTPTPDDTAMLGPLLFQGGFYILKAHGDIDRVDNVVLTASDYRRISHANPAFEALFSAILLTKTVLFVGYSLERPGFQPVAGPRADAFQRLSAGTLRADDRLGEDRGRHLVPRDRPARHSLREPGRPARAGRDLPARLAAGHQPGTGCRAPLRVARRWDARCQRSLEMVSFATPRRRKSRR